MSWQATIARTERNGETLKVVVHYSDDSDHSFDQIVTVSDNQDDTYMTNIVNTKLNQLNGLDTYEVALSQSDVFIGTSTVDNSGQIVVTVPVITPPDPVILGGTQ